MISQYRKKEPKGSEMKEEDHVASACWHECAKYDASKFRLVPRVLFAYGPFPWRECFRAQTLVSSRNHATDLESRDLL